VMVCGKIVLTELGIVLVHDEMDPLNVSVKPVCVETHGTSVVVSVVAVTIGPVVTSAVPSHLAKEEAQISLQDEILLITRSPDVFIMM
jgi:hypothetical protein